jgi:outer membrane protein OmpA-like peptidoglycan-associated protein
MKSKTLAFALLASSVSVGANAYETSSYALGSTSEDTNAASEHESTYWGVGLGTVFGALIGGPPGAAIGASIGGSLGWGVDNQAALDETELSLAEKELALLQRDEAISSQQARLVKTQQVVAVLSETNAEQAKQLALFEEKGGKRALNQSLEQNTLEQVASHYSHEVYYRNGQHAVPDYAQQKLLGLAEFLVEHPSLEVSLKGYTDHRGSPELNKKLAQARTEGVKDLLVAQGVSAYRIHLKAIGEGELKAKPGEPSNYALDRRVAIELQVNDVNAMAETKNTEEEPEQGTLALDEEQGIETLEPAQASVSSDAVSTDAVRLGAVSLDAYSQESAIKAQHLSRFMTFAEAR